MNPLGKWWSIAKSVIPARTGSKLATLISKFLFQCLVIITSIVLGLWVNGKAERHGRTSRAIKDLMRIRDEIETNKETLAHDLQTHAELKAVINKLEIALFARLQARNEHPEYFKDEKSGDLETKIFPRSPLQPEKPSLILSRSKYLTASWDLAKNGESFRVLGSGALQRIAMLYSIQDDYIQLNNRLIAHTTSMAEMPLFFESTYQLRSYISRVDLVNSDIASLEKAANELLGLYDKASSRLENVPQRNSLWHRIVQQLDTGD